jgi:hypothetical protein
MASEQIQLYMANSIVSEWVSGFSNNFQCLEHGLEQWTIVYVVKR